MRLRALIVIIVTLLLSGAGYWYWQTYNPALPSVEEITDLLPASISTPEPLRHTDMGVSGQLTADGVFTFTNNHRAQESKAALSRNAVLDQAAQNKLNDMLAQQYFDHESPDGRGPSDVVEAVNYDYITVGENLALGDFASDADLVQAWMDSPGHRANILASQFTEIGIAVGKGQFEGQTTWLAVQTFAKPSSACPIPNKNLSSQIDTLKQQIQSANQSLPPLGQEIHTKQVALQEYISQDDFDRDQAQAMQDEINQLINQFNQIVTDANKTETQLKQVIQRYNQQVNAYNTCAAS